jgi:hypothetical protein
MKLPPPSATSILEVALPAPSPSAALSESGDGSPALTCDIGLQGCRAAGLQGCRAAGLQGCRAAAATRWVAANAPTPWQPSAHLKLEHRP